MNEGQIQKKLDQILHAQAMLIAMLLPPVPGTVGYRGSAKVAEQIEGYSQLACDIFNHIAPKPPDPEPLDLPEAEPL